jgi:hypothetical protein
MRTWIAHEMPRVVSRARSRLAEFRDSDRGDVPGWVMVTLMSALLVAAIFAVAQTQLTSILSEALKGVLP